MGGEPFRNQDAVQDDLALDEGVEDFSWAHTRVEVVFAWLDPSFGILDLAEEPKPERADDESLLSKQTGDSFRSEERRVGKGVKSWSVLGADQRHVCGTR